MRYCMQPGETDGPITPLFTVPEFQQRLLRLDGGGDEHRDDERDEVLYVLEGRGAATVGDERRELEPGTGVFVARGPPWRGGPAGRPRAPPPPLPGAPPPAARPPAGRRRAARA